MYDKTSPKIRTEIESAKADMRRGMLEFVVLLIISREKIYASDILKKLKLADLLIVEGTLYPLLSRLRSEKLLNYTWEESKSGPPRKYYTLTPLGEEDLAQLKTVWRSLIKSVDSLIAGQSAPSDEMHPE
ncbi:MAG: PadR family transcriptional regulator [Candidatus Paceibacterota bacterium]|jgi:PadR family transcriptional regulator PadR|nr:PadR family transcriptional regulator [Candidatus Paceibacterota bacterium]